MDDDVVAMRASVLEGIPDELPPHPGYDESVDHAPNRRQILSAKDKRLALENALRYIPPAHHAEMADEFMEELETYGRILMRRYRPTSHPIKAYPLDAYPAKSRQAAAIMLMIHNNLDPAVAQFPHELITYGGNGSVFQNWAQYRLVMKYLCEMTDNQTLVMYSGHPLGLFPSHEEAPRVVVTNGMVIPNHSSQDDYERMNALGVTQYGQMTAGSYMYIGPQGIVHGTTITLLNAARLHLGLSDESDLAGITFITSGLGGMSGAQAKAATIAGAACIIAETNAHAAHKRHEQGWLTTVSIPLMMPLTGWSPPQSKVRPSQSGWLATSSNCGSGAWNATFTSTWGATKPASIIPTREATSQPIDPTRKVLPCYRKTRSNFAQKFKPRFGGTQPPSTPWQNGACTSGIMAMRFYSKPPRWSRVSNDDGSFTYPSYVEDIMGPLCFDYGFGPYRWVCTSGKPEDLERTDAIAADVLRQMRENAPEDVRQQINDNLRWIEQAGANRLVVGSQARILYADDIGRREIALAMNRAVASGELQGPVVLGRDHHDVSGTDSPYRETANIRDGSMFTADMAVQNAIGDAFRGATWVSLHNGGGVGWGEVINGGFGMLLDGSSAAEQRLQSMLHWDVNNGVARRAWARNPGARAAISRAMEAEEGLTVTLPHLVDESILDRYRGDAP